MCLLPLARQLFPNNKYRKVLQDNYKIMNWMICSRYEATVQKLTLFKTQFIYIQNIPEATWSQFFSFNFSFLFFSASVKNGCRKMWVSKVWLNLYFKRSYYKLFLFNFLTVLWSYLKYGMFVILKWFIFLLVML